MKRKTCVFMVLIFSFLYSGVLGFTYYRGYWPAEVAAVREKDAYLFEFIEPLYFDSYGAELIIRNDTMGAGHFGAPRGGGARTHAGVDLYAPIGTPVLAAERGLVETGYSPGGYGLIVRVHHDMDEGDYSTVYAHLSRITVSDGDVVERGDVIGKVGRSGNADYDNMKPHLHFELRQGNVPVEPMDYLLSGETVESVPY